MSQHARMRLPQHGRDHRPGGEDPIPGIEVTLTEVAAVYGMINRSGAAGNMSITSGALNATTTLITHDTITYEVGVDCDIVSSPTRITILEDGLYVILKNLVDVDSGAGDYGIAVGHGKNTSGAVWTPSAVVRRVLSSGFGRVQGISFFELSVGDYITQVVGQNSGSTKTLTYLADLFVARIPGPITEADLLDTIDGGTP